MESEDEKSNRQRDGAPSAFEQGLFRCTRVTTSSGLCNFHSSTANHDIEQKEKSREKCGARGDDLMCVAERTGFEELDPCLVTFGAAANKRPVCNTFHFTCQSRCFSSHTLVLRPNRSVLPGAIFHPLTDWRPKFSDRPSH